ncbi:MULTISPECIES: GntR family transcriptional regulator [Streptomyces]|uniref:GntR family transcriptional regulator n=1 Tax=Streptomyces TaxID=1883 RepID=UPI001D13FF74|nr:MULTISPECIES: GntR family transcriptional regulator [Streptomyces]MCC3654816.1 GntR family transcriptional regulator [Streptomyces sp. S07_1.15]WSQ70837.1 GntR family transcriptional regulator [Streptomyces xinghaiensis]
MPEGNAAVHEAYDAVRTRMTDGRYAQGQILTPEAVATETSLPLPAIKAAFGRLAEENALRFHPPQGALILPLDLEEARDVMEARLLLEMFAIDSVVARGREHARRLGRALEPLLHEKDTSEATLLQARQFHGELVAAAGNAVVALMHETLWDRSLHVAAASTAGPDNRRGNVAEHRAIAEALCRGEGARARRLVYEHIAAILRRVGVGDELALPRPADA